MLKRIERYWTAFENICITGFFWILVVFNFLNVFTRKLMPEHGMAFVEDISMLMFLWLIFFAAAQCYTTESHLGLPFVYEKFSPVVKIIVFTFITVFSLSFYCVVIRYTWNLAVNQYSMHIRTSMGYPAWWGGAALPIGSAFVIIRMIQQYIKQVKALLSEAKNTASSQISADNEKEAT